MYLPQGIITKASDVLGTRMGAVAMAGLVNGRFDASAVIINPGVGDLSPEELADRNVLLSFAAEDAVNAVVDFLTGSQGEAEVSKFSYIDADGAAVCLLSDPEDGELQTKLLQGMRS